MPPAHATASITAAVFGSKTVRHSGVYVAAMNTEIVAWSARRHHCTALEVRHGQRWYIAETPKSRNNPAPYMVTPRAWTHCSVIHANVISTAAASAESIAAPKWNQPRMTGRAPRSAIT